MSDERVLTIRGNRATRPVSDFQMMTMGRGDAYYVDAANGSDSLSGRSPTTALATISEAYDKATADQHDIIYLLGGSTAFTETAELTWAKSYTHLIGLCASCMNPRARIENSGNAIANLLSITASGCIFKNFRIGNYGTGAAALGSVELSGGRNYFEDVTFFGPGHATPAGETGSRALVLAAAEENRFINCNIGGMTIARTADAPVFELSGACARNEFIHCDFIGACDDASYALCKIGSSVFGYHKWEECNFFNFSVNHATTVTEVFDVTVTTTQDHLFINPRLFGIAELDAGDVAGFTVVGPATAAACGIGVTPTT